MPNVKRTLRGIEKRAMKAREEGRFYKSSVKRMVNADLRKRDARGRFAKSSEPQLAKMNVASRSTVSKRGQPRRVNVYDLRTKWQPSQRWGAEVAHGIARQARKHIDREQAQILSVVAKTPKTKKLGRKKKNSGIRGAVEKMKNSPTKSGGKRTPYVFEPEKLPF